MQAEAQSPQSTSKQVDAKPVLALISVICVIAAVLYFLPSKEEQKISISEFNENFNGESISFLESQGWSVWYKPRMEEITGYTASYPVETLTIENGTLKAEKGAGGLVYPANWSNFTLNVAFKRSTVTWGGIAFRCDNTWVSGTEDNLDSGSWCANGYFLQLGFEDSTNKIWKISNGEMTSIASKDLNIAKGIWHYISLQIQGSTITTYVDNQLLFDIQGSGVASGGIGLINTSGYVWFDNLKITF